MSEQVIAGIGHDLSDRLSSLFGLIQLAELDGSIERSLSEPLHSELTRVEELVRLLRALPGTQDERAEPIRVTELFPTIRSLIRRHRGLEGVEIAFETSADPVVFARWSELLRGILELISRAAREVSAGDGTVVRVHLRVTGEFAELEVARSDDGDRPMVRFELYSG